MDVNDEVTPADNNHNRVLLKFKRSVIEKYFKFVKAPPKIVAESSGTD